MGAPLVRACVCCTGKPLERYGEHEALHQQGLFAAKPGGYQAGGRMYASGSVSFIAPSALSWKRVRCGGCCLAPTACPRCPLRAWLGVQHADRRQAVIMSTEDHLPSFSTPISCIVMRL